MLAEIRHLLDLQSIDERIADCEARLIRLQRARERHEEQIEVERETVTAAQQSLAQMEHDSRMKNLAVDELDMQIRGYRKRLDEGIISFKEMEDLRAKIELERTRMSRLEDEALSLMDAIEGQRSASARAQEAFEARASALRAQIEESDANVEKTKSELVSLRADRASAAENMPPYLRSQYEALHAEMKHPVAEVRGGVCTGCKLRVSGNTAERARGEMGLVTCEHCSRILYSV